MKCHVIFLKFLRDVMVVCIQIVVHMIQQKAWSQKNKSGSYVGDKLYDIIQSPKTLMWHLWNFQYVLFVKITIQFYPIVYRW